MCLLGPSLGLFEPADSGIPRRQVRQIVCSTSDLHGCLPEFGPVSSRMGFRGSPGRPDRQSRLPHGHLGLGTHTSALGSRSCRWATTHSALECNASWPSSLAVLTGIVPALGTRRYEPDQACSRTTLEGRQAPDIECVATKRAQRDLNPRPSDYEEQMGRSHAHGSLLLRSWAIVWNRLRCYCFCYCSSPHSRRSGQAKPLHRFAVDRTRAQSGQREGRFAGSLKKGRRQVGGWSPTVLHTALALKETMRQPIDELGRNLSALLLLPFQGLLHDPASPINIQFKLAQPELLRGVVACPCVVPADVETDGRA